jgi:hypothetical protein
MMEIGKQDKKKVTVNICGLVEIIMKVNGLIIQEKVKEQCNGQIKMKNKLEIGKMGFKTVKGHIYGQGIIAQNK